jgi:circadian clock protein KaiC
MVRKLEILKMRGQPTLAGLHTFRITQAGVHVFAPINAIDADPLADLGPADTARAGLGTAGLDEMMGGGLPRGFSLLVAGPSGSGKSILASAFLAEGARCGEAGVIAAFEQRPNRLRSQVVANLIEQGRVTLVDSTAVDLCIGEVVALIMNAVHQQRARRVVIDSLSAFELALAPTFRADFRESMLRLVTALSHVGVTVLMTSELEDRYTDLRFSPYGTAFLTDAIIVQRYIEVEGRLRRVMAVAKVRASEHSNELREYTIDAHGIHLGRCLDDHDGLLGGHPVHRPPLP